MHRWMDGWMNGSSALSGDNVHQCAQHTIRCDSLSRRRRVCCSVTGIRTRSEIRPRFSTNVEGSTDSLSITSNLVLDGDTPITSAASLSVFRHKLKIFLFQKFFS